MEESFHFSILRISICQMLKSSGFDKCQPSIVNILTDIYIRYLTTLLKKSIKYSIIRQQSNQIQIQDILQSMIDIEFIKPSSFESALDIQDDYPKFETSRKIQHQNYNTKSIESFVDWLKYSDNFRISKKLVEVPENLLINLIEKRKIDESNETDQERKKRKLKERQEFYNQFKVGDISGKRPVGLIEQHEPSLIQEDETIELTKEDKLSWLIYLTEKDLKFGHNLKYLNTNLSNYLLEIQKNGKYHPNSKDLTTNYQFYLKNLKNLNKFDYVIDNLKEYYDEIEDEINEEDKLLPSKELEMNLPYNIKYNSELLNDNLDQYIEYTSKEQETQHEDEQSEEQVNNHVKDGIIINDDGIGGDNNLMFM
ncbi:hypothetical protein HYPBUDRAFT_122280 [Hyphopichia burtonii NRRL Y-1933]|uniref:Bromodomain associated domain-containing protein n=1 Tax=Hyphopichia burtonii NRRL Y-1933 TaxID=984485 RepID=A0A1E4RKP4_9ASCO|nr:hypothetical protein HYPBUDRAFT_122280 [Hyphopichia burtonii NRRL Y-1933]ODV67655.1 hypothetical protein HYPBUDRAFT_122280 [Hyphopichia burtonii NRRL Y-1933]